MISSLSAQPAATWPTWGGVNHNFTVRDPGLADSWPASGPKKLWSREFGDGYAAIAEDAGALFTMYRHDKSHSIVIALDAATGKTIWEHPFDDSPSGKDLQYGPGPHVMPQVVGGRVFATGISGKMFCLDEKSGNIIWKHDLVADFGAEPMDRGYGNNPMPYKDTLLIPLGGKGASIIALKQSDGTTVWKNADAIGNSYSSPILINVGGKEQAVFFMANVIVGVDPATGKTLWKHDHKTDYGLNISTPLWDGNLLFMSSAYSGGSRVLQLSYEGGTTRVKEVWFSPKLRIHITNAIRKGGFVLGSSGDFGPSFLAAVDINTGAELWRDRSFARGNMVLAGGKLIFLDEDGKLVLAKPDAKGLNVIAKAEVLHNNAWTPPTLVGTTLYLRDRTKIMALELK